VYDSDLVIFVSSRRLRHCDIEKSLIRRQ
jgi:hypothetical protein